MKKLLLFLLLLCGLIACKKEQDGQITFWHKNPNDSYLIKFEGSTSTRGPVKFSASAPGCGDGITVRMPEGTHKIVFSSRTGNASIDRQISWKDGECRVYEIK